jgi:hypothetical protein
LKAKNLASAEVTREGWPPKGGRATAAALTV